MLEKKGGQMPPVHPPGYAPGMLDLYNIIYIISKTEKFMHMTGEV